jgi:hypothetical protein
MNLEDRYSGFDIEGRCVFPRSTVHFSNNAAFLLVAILEYAQPHGNWQYRQGDALAP